MILDADLSVAPKEPSRSYRVLTEGHGEFINGSRMVYQMERRAMRSLNLLGHSTVSRALTWILGQRSWDTPCGTKGIWRTDYERSAAGRSYFGDFDLLLGVVKLNLEVCGVPVPCRARVYGQTNISSFRHGLLLPRMT
jgi:hypothetical protein